MGLWDDLKKAAGNVGENVGDFFDGGDDKPDKPINFQRPDYDPQFQGNVFQHLNPAFKKREDEFEKPLWMQGADQQSPYSSWDTKYLDRVFKQQDELVDKGELGEQFDRDDATGIVTWDHITKGGKELKFGDIFDGGKLVGNLYEDKTGTEADADLMMSQFLLEPEELAAIGEDRDPTARMRDTIAKVRENNNIEIPQALGAQAQQKNVDETQGDIQGSIGGLGDDLLSGGLGVGGGIVLGSPFGLPGMLIGGGIGGVASWLNRDDISEQTASALEITKKAYNDGEGNVIGDTASAAKQFAGVAGRGLTPTSNLVRGLLDSDRGNGIGALQEEDKPSWAKPLDIAATIADMGFTFGSRAGITAYTGQMGIHSAGAVTELTLGGGERWDPQAGEFRNVYENEQGEFSAANAAGAWASTGIDVAQLAMVRGIANKISGVDTRLVGKEINGGTVAAIEQRAGRTFYLDADKKVLDSKTNWSQAFIPSEGVSMLAAGGAARASAARSLSGARAVNADDLYKASVQLDRAESPIKAALVNAVGEGTEEAAQEALDTWSFDHKVSLQQLSEAYAYGAASGLGMGFAMNYRTRTADDAEMKASVEEGYVSVHGKLPENWDDVYKAMTPEQRREHVTNILTAEERQQLLQTDENQMSLQTSTTKSNQLITSMQNMVVQQELDRVNKKSGAPGDSTNRASGNPIFSAAQRNADGSTKFMGGTFADDAASQGPRGQLHYYEQRLKALPKVLATINTQLEEARGVVARFKAEVTPENPEGANTEAAQQNVERLEDMYELWAGTEKFLPDLIKITKAQVGVLTDTSLDWATRIETLDILNKQLDTAYRSGNDSLSLAAAVLRLRMPLDNTGSFYVGAPAIRLSDTKDNVENSYGADWASLDVTTADFDGDRFTNSVGVMLGRTAFRNAQIGRAWLSTSINADTGEQESRFKAASVATDKAASVTAHEVHNATVLGAAQDVPRKWLFAYAKSVNVRYGVPDPDDAATKALYNVFAARLLTRSNSKPVEELMEFFATDPAYAPLVTKYAVDHKTNEPSTLLGMYRSQMDGMQNDINKVAASLIPVDERKGAQQGAANDMHPNAEGQHKTIASQAAATLLGTFFQYMGTNDLLRVGQFLRLSHEDYTDRGMAKADSDPLLDVAGRQLRALSQGHIKSAQDAELNEFDITAQVREMALEIVAADPRVSTRREQEAAAFTLLLQDFGDTQFSGKDGIAAPRNVSVAQALTSAYIAQLRVDAAVPLSRDANLKRKVDMLERAANDARSDNESERPRGEMMIMKDALGAFNVANVLTIGAVADWATSGLLITGSIEQNIRFIAQKNPQVRAQLKRAMLDRTDLGNKRELYETMVHFMFEVAQTEYGIEPDGKIKGRVGVRNEDASESAMEMRENVIQAVVESGRSIEDRQAIIDTLQTQGGRQILEGLISDAGLAAFVSNSDGTYTLRDWVVEFFRETDPGKAEVMLWSQRAFSLLTLNQARLNLKTEETEEEYTRIDDSLARLMVHLREKNPIGFRNLRMQIDAASDRASLEKWINSQDWGFGMPVLMYENSTAQFDPALASGGWGASSVSYGSAIRELLQPSLAFKRRVSQQKKNNQANVATAGRVLAQRRANQNDPEFSRLQAEQKRAEKLSVKAMHPNDALDAIWRAYELATEMHTKGGEHEAFEAYGSAQVQEAVQTNFADPFIDAANLMIGTRDMADLRQRPELVFHTDAFVNEYGTTVEMPALRGADGQVDLELVLEAIANDAETGLADILTEALLLRQYAYDRATGVTSVTTSGPRTLEDLVARRYEASFKAVDGRFTPGANASYGAEVSAAAQDANYEHVAVFERAVIAIATPRVLSSRGWSRAQVALEIENVRNQLGAALRRAGNVLAKSPELYASVTRQAVLDLVDAQLEAQRGRGADRGTFRSVGVAVRSRTREMVDEMIDNLREQFQAHYSKEQAADALADFDLLSKHASGTDVLNQEALQELHQRIMARGNLTHPMVQLLNSIVSGNPLKDLHAEFGTGKNITTSQRDAITAYLAGKEIDVDKRVRHNPDAVAALRNFREPDYNRTSLNWDMLSRIVLSHIVQSEAVEGWSTTDQMIVFMDDRTLDPTFSLVLEHLFDPKNPMIAAAAGIGANRPEPVEGDKLHDSMMALFPADGSIRWDQSISGQAMALDAMVPPISAAAAAGLKGNGGKTIDALAMASRTFVPDKAPDASLLQAVTLEYTAEGFVIRDSSVPLVDISIIEGSIGMASVNSQPVTLEPMVGLPIKLPYQAITLQRLREHTPVVGMTVEVQYFHPMYRPFGSQHMNNIYFDGVIAHNLSQVNEFVSLIAEMYNQPDGILQLGTRSVLDAVKEKMPAVTRMHVTAQGGWDLNEAPDPTAYLGAMAQVLAEDVDFGYRGLGSAWGKATLKYVTMRHIVRYNDGVFASVHDYLAAQRADPKGTAAREPELIGMSERTANTLYGEAGTQGLQGFPLDGRLSTGSQTFSWDALTPRQKDLLKNMSKKPVKLRDTSAAKRNALPGAQSVKSSRDTGATEDLASLIALIETRSEVMADRRPLIIKNGLDPRAMREQQRTVANKLTSDDNVNQYVPSDDFEQMISRLGHEESEFAVPDSLNLLLTGQGSLEKGMLTPGNYKTLGSVLGRLTFGDSIVVHLEGLAEFDVNTIMEIMRTLVASKVTISLRGTNSRIDGVAERARAVTQYLRSMHDYEPLIETADTFAPREAVNAYQLESAYESRLMEQGFRTATSRLMTLVPTGRTLAGFGALNESQSYILNQDKRYIVRTALIKQFADPLAQPLHEIELKEISDLILSLRDKMLDPEFAATIEETEGLSYVDAVKDLMDRAKNGTLQIGTKNLYMKKGMFEVYVVRDPQAGEKPKLYLHRYGSKFAKHNDIKKFKSSKDQFKIGSAETEAQQTVVEGRTTGIRFHGASDIQLTIEAEQMWLGNKIIPLFGGDKTMATDLPPGLDYIRGAIAGVLESEYLVAEADEVKKISMLDKVGTFTQAAEVLGFDNMPIFFKGFYGRDYIPVTDDVEMDTLRTILDSVRKDSTATPGRIQNLVSLLARGLDGRHEPILSLVAPEYTKLLSADLLGGKDTAEVRILLAAIAYLSIPGTNLASIERAGGFTTQESHEAGRGSLRMPTVFTSIYDLSDAAFNIAHTAFKSRLEPGWDLNRDYTLRRWFDDGKQFQDFHFGFSLQSVVGESVGENFDPTKEQSTSSHNLRLAEQAVGGMFATSHSAAAFDDFMGAATAWDTITPLRLPMERKNSPQPWVNMGINRVSFRERVRVKLADFFTTIDLTNQGEIHKVDQRRLEERIRKIAIRLFSDSTGRSDGDVHTLLRLALGRPAPSPDASAEEFEASRINLATLELGLKGIEGNIKLGISPLRRGAEPLVPPEIGNKIIIANVGKTGGWKMRMYTKGKRSQTTLTETVDDYRAAFFDHALGDPEANNMAGFNNVLDAVVHQYQELTSDIQSLPVSLNLMLDFDLIRRDMLAEDEIKKLVDNKVSYAQFAAEHPDKVKSSIFSSTETLLTPQFMHDIASSATMSQQLGLVDPRMLDNDQPSADMLQYIEARFAAYDRKKDLPFPTKRSVAGRRAAGLESTDNESNSHPLFRNLLSLHAAKALLTPALALGAMIDSRMRLIVADTRRMITGEGTGFMGRRMARVVESQGTIGSLARGFGWRTMYTQEQTAKFNSLLNTTATTSVMGEAIAEDLADYADYLRSAKVWGWLRKANQIATNLQDFGRGTKGKTLRRNYMHAAISYAVHNDMASAQTLIDGLGVSGDYIKRKFPEAHRAGIMAMNDLRGVQDTMISSAVSAAIKPLTHSGNAGVNGVAQMTLAMPLMFQRYAANLFLTLTGMRAFDQLAAHALRGRTRPGFWQEISAKASSKDAEVSPVIEVEDVIGSLDAMDAVINMGITHSLLFTGGLVMGGLGLSGEDEEEKRRRRAAAAQGAVWLSDPRDIENDFRNAHALFLDEIPGLNMLFANDAGRAIASPHWILKPLTSPLMGMNRFFETGDIKQLKWGFEDAITSMPLLNMITFNKAVTMSEELSHAAQDSAASGNVGASDSAAFLTHLVGYYESALFESSFLNALYTGFDDYDRDPYVMPLRDSDGTLQRDAEGNVRANSDQHLTSDGVDGRGKALQPYVDDEGNVQQGYWTESDASTKSRIMAENRLSFALVSSLFTGLAGKGMNTRYDMAVKTRSVDKPELKEDEQMAIVLGQYVNQANADLMKGGKQTAEHAVTLSFLNNYGEEVLSDEGAMAIFRGLAGGSVTSNDAALQGVYVDFEARQNIQAKWLDELVIEGMKLGLSESSAKYRADRVWNGSGSLPGIADILWSKDIPYSKTQEFQQLNTTYLKGPDGNIWATGFARDKFLGAIGLAPLRGLHTSRDTHTDLDGRMNVSGFGINNTGMRSLRPVNDSLDVPTDSEIGDTITKAIENMDGQGYSGGFGRGGYGGGGGGGGYAQRPVNDFGYPARWTNQNFNPITLRVPYANDVYSIRTDDVRTDLSTIRRERISSERGRLTPWQ